MNVYVLTLYDPAAQFGYTEVFTTVEGAMRYAGVKGWKKRGTVYTWSDGETKVRVKEKYGMISWQCDSSVFKIRKKRLRGKPAPVIRRGPRPRRV